MLKGLLLCGILLVLLAALLYPPNLSPPKVEKPLPGTLKGHFPIIDQDRTYYIHGQSPPTILALHGAGQSALEMERQSGLSAMADRRHFTVVYPEGRLYPGLITKLQFEVAKTGPVFVVGLSQGALVAAELAINEGAHFSGVVMVSGALTPEMVANPPSHAIPILIIQGKADSQIPYQGGKLVSGLTVLPAEESLQYWVHSYGCGTCSSQGNRRAYTGGTAPVFFYGLPGGGHEWPSGDFDAAEAIGDFCSAVGR